LPAGLLDHLHSIAARSDIGNDNMGPVLSKPLRERLADTVRTARDDRDFIVVGFGHAVTFPFPCPLIEPDVPISCIQLSEWFDGQKISDPSKARIRLKEGVQAVHVGA